MRTRLLATASLITGLGSLLCSPAAMADAGNWLVRLRALQVSPNDDSGSVSSIPGSGVGVGSDTTPELDFTYFITRNLGVEAILGSSQNNINGKGSIVGLNKIAEVRTLPPTVTLQYHFQPDASIRPYAGLGINYTRFYDEKASSSLEGALGPTDVELSSSWGLSGQLGVDIAVNRNWFVNFDLKYIQMNTTATLNSSGTVRKVNVDINPWFIGAGVGRRF
ncbi:MAG TPA: OmpW family protein [Gammaproteobacteria bacterium]|nr:OmpW family protein [Gammaproteobacteria bacterium]